MYDKEANRHTYTVVVKGLNGLGMERKDIYTLAVERSSGEWEITQFRSD